MVCFSKTKKLHYILTSLIIRLFKKNPQTWAHPCVYRTWVISYMRASLMAQMVRNLPAIWETWVGSLGREDPLKEEMATHSSILAWKIPRTEEPVGYSSWGCKKLDITEQLTLSLTLVEMPFPVWDDSLDIHESHECFDLDKKEETVNP